MIEIRFEEREKIGLQYILESLHGCSPFGQERIRRLRYYTPDQRQELELELYNVERAAAHAEELKRPDLCGAVPDEGHPRLPAPVPGAGGAGPCGAV